jgi:hypothetical protein
MISSCYAQIGRPYLPRPWEEQTTVCRTVLIETFASLAFNASSAPRPDMSRGISGRVQFSSSSHVLRRNDRPANVVFSKRYTKACLQLGENINFRRHA